MSFTSHFPLFSSIATKLSEKLDSKENNKTVIEQVDVTFRELTRNRSDINGYYCHILYRPETHPTRSAIFFHGDYTTKQAMLDSINYFANTFTILRLTTGCVFK